MRWVEERTQEREHARRSPCYQRLWGFLCIMVGVLLIFLCIPFELWMLLVGAALILVGYFWAFGR